MPSNNFFPSANLPFMSQPFVWTNCALSIYWVSIGLGKHISQVSWPHSRLVLILFIVNLVYNTGLSLVKMSVLIFYIRIFGSVQAYKVAFWILGAIILGWYIAVTLLALFNCVPLNKLWNPSISGHCVSQHSAFLGATISNFIVDFMILFLPMPMLWQLHLETSRKIGLVAVFTAGYAYVRSPAAVSLSSANASNSVIILSILRLQSIVVLGDAVLPDISCECNYALGKNRVPTELSTKHPFLTLRVGNLAYPQILVTLELSIALIGCCLPSIFNLIKHGARRQFSSWFQNTIVSKPLDGPAVSRIGPTGNPIEDRRNNIGFVLLQPDYQDTYVPPVFSNTVGVDNCATAFSAEHNRGHRRKDEETGIPLHHIHVRKDIEIEAWNRPPAL